MRRHYLPLSGLKSVIFGTPLDMADRLRPDMVAFAVGQAGADRQRFGLLPESRPYEMIDRQPNPLSDILKLVHVCPIIRQLQPRG